MQSEISTPESIIFNFGAAATGNININATIGGTKTNHIVIAPIGSNTGIADNIIGGNTGKLVTSATGDLTISATTDIRGAIVVSKTATTVNQLQIVTTQLSAETALGDIAIKDSISSTSFLVVNKLNAGNNIHLSSGGGLKSQGLNLFVDFSGTPLTAGGKINVDTKNAIQALFDPTLPDNNISDSKLLSLSDKEKIELLKLIDSNIKSGNLFNANVKPTEGTAGGNPLSLDLTKNSISLNASGNLDLSGLIGNSSATVTVNNSREGASVSGTAVLSGKSILIQTTNGDIGSAAPNGGLHVITSNLITQAGSGDVFIANTSKSTIGMSASQAASISITSSGGVNLNGLTSTNGSIQVAAAGTTVINNLESAGGVTIDAGGATTIGNIQTTGIAGDINIKNSSGLLQTAVNSKIAAQNGAIYLQNSNTKTGSIVIGQGSDIETGTSPSTGLGGKIGISIGALPSTPVLGSPPPASLVTYSEIGGTIYWGSNSISGLSKAGINQIIAKNADVIFSTGNLKSSAIKLNGAV
ncbi:MAG: hypothetical protein JSS86_21690, partial [Cyanobacteria bacterium SZAS LIN-2]|nr:hypothetical protein [Cyanobacteria bacterium SZAS LIN-2]